MGPGGVLVHNSYRREAGKSVRELLEESSEKLEIQALSAPKKTGQKHHVISKRIGEELNNHPTLKGHFTPRDKRYILQAVNKDAHRGYQKWHRELDDEIVAWLKERKDVPLTPEQFLEHLRRVYNRPALRERFMNDF